MSPKLNVKRVIIFKHGISYFILEGKLEGNGSFELEFNLDEMNDVLKSLLAMDTSEQGYISSISYDAALDSNQLLKSIILDIPDRDSFTSLITQIKGGQVKLKITGAEQGIKGTIMGIEFMEKMVENAKITEKQITLLKNDLSVTKIPFNEVKSIDILNEDLKKDLKFFLNTIISTKKKDSKKIIINCESGGEQKERKIVVSYIRESPIWKTSYRLLMSKEQASEEKCLLSGWCMVENTTNQDWEEIQLSLVAGMPVSFVYDFYKPIYITRPKVEPPRILSARPTEIEEGVGAEDYRSYKMEEEAEMKAMAPPAPKKAKMANYIAAPGAGRASRYQSIVGEMDDTAVMDKLKTSTKISQKDLGELFEYNISNPVTIERKKSALVPILTEEIKSKKILLYNKNENDKNPNACLEVTNNTELMLERGPATIIYDDNLAGEAIIPFMNKGDTRILNYAVEQAVIIDTSQRSENQAIHRISFGGSYIYEYYNTNLFSEYKIRNKTEEAKELYLDHPKSPNYKFVQKPVEPEETSNYWRFKLTLKPKDAISFKLKEQRENHSSYYILNWSKDDLIKKIEFYTSKRFIDEKLESQLKDIAQMIGDLRELSEKKTKLENERDQMSSEQDRLRQNISVLGNSSQEASLREKYIKKLTHQENRYEEIKKEIEAVNIKIQQLNKQVEKMIRNLKT